MVRQLLIVIKVFIFNIKKLQYTYKKIATFFS